MSKTICCDKCGGCDGEHWFPCVPTEDAEKRAREIVDGWAQHWDLQPVPDDDHAQAVDADLTARIAAEIAVPAAPSLSPEVEAELKEIEARANAISAPGTRSYDETINDLIDDLRRLLALLRSGQRK